MKDTAYIPPKVGEIAKLDVTQTAKHRIFAGLSWNSNDQKGTAQYFQAQFLGSMWIMIKDPQMIKNFVKNPALLYQKDDLQGREINDPNFDLDLSCFAFDNDGNFKDWVDPDAYKAIDGSEKMYHSGESMDGAGFLDDEQIHIELKDIDKHYSHFFVIIESDCMHKLSNVKDVHVRLADSVTNSNFLDVNISKLEGNERYSFVFCHVFKKDSQWHVKNISEFVDDNQNWPEFLKKYL